MAFKQLTDKPASHPPLENGYTREIVLDICADTDKALLVKLEDGKEVWVPRSVCKLRYPYLKPISLIDGKTVIDIKNWWYDQNLK